MSVERRNVLPAETLIPAPATTTIFLLLRKTFISTSSCSRCSSSARVVRSRFNLWRGLGSDFLCLFFASGVFSAASSTEFGRFRFWLLDAVAPSSWVVSVVSCEDAGDGYLVLGDMLRTDDSSEDRSLKLLSLSASNRLGECIEGVREGVSSCRAVGTRKSGTC